MTYHDRAIGMAPPGSDEWHAMRRTGIGGSDIGKILGLSPYGGPWDVFRDKTEPKRRRSSGLQAAAGNVLEPLILRWVAKQEGWNLRAEKHTFRDPDCPHAIVNPDAVRWAPVAVPDGPAVAVQPVAACEIKTASFRVRHQWVDGPPLWHRAQAIHTAMVLGLPDAWITAWPLGSPTIDVYHVPVVQTDVDMIREAIEAFWWHIEHNELPPIDHTEACAAGLVARYGIPRKVEAPLPQDLAFVALKYESLGKEIAQLKQARDTCRNTIIQMAAETGVGKYASPGGEIKVTTYGRNRLDPERLIELAADPALAEPIDLDQYRTKLDTAAIRTDLPGLYKLAMAPDGIAVRVTTKDPE